MGDNPAMKLHFTKMQGAGNDFVMLDATAAPLALDRERLRRLADRRFGVGADQILVVEAAPDASVDFRYRIFNADGQEVEQCGNGARCFFNFVQARGLSRKDSLRVLTAGGVIEPRRDPDGGVSVDMGQADFTLGASGFDADGLVPRQEHEAQLWPLAAGAFHAELVVVSMGNPHAVQFVDDVDAAPVTVFGPLIERHARFARGVNAGFAQVIDRGQLRLRVWERGTGETLACGSGACAAVAAGIRRGLLDDSVRVQARGGELQVRLAGSLRMSGPAQTVFEGEIEL